MRRPLFYKKNLTNLSFNQDIIQKNSSPNSGELFTKPLKTTYQMGKGRTYSENEIIKYLQIYGIKKENDNLKNKLKIITPIGTHIASLINIGHITHVNMKGREQCAIQPFPCYHIVDTVGYVIYNIRKKLSNRIIVPVGKIVKVNFTEDQIKRKKRKKRKKEKKREKRKKREKKKRKKREKNKRRKRGMRVWYKVVKCKLTHITAAKAKVLQRSP